MNSNLDGVSSTTGDSTANKNQTSQLPISIPDDSSNGVILIHSDSQQSLDRLFNPQGEPTVPLRQRNLPSSFFNPNDRSSVMPNQNLHHRSTSYNFAGNLSSQQQQQNNHQHQPSSLHMRTHSAQVTLMPGSHQMNPSNGHLSSVSGSHSSELHPSCSNQSLHHPSPRLSQVNLNSSSNQLNQIPVESGASVQPQMRAAPSQSHHHYRNYSSPASMHHSKSQAASSMNTNQQANNHTRALQSTPTNNHFIHHCHNHQDQHQMHQQNIPQDFNNHNHNRSIQQPNGSLDPYRQFGGSPNFMDTSNFATTEPNHSTFNSSGPTIHYHQSHSHSQGHHEGHNQVHIYHQTHGQIMSEPQKFHIAHAYPQQPSQAFNGSSYEPQHVTTSGRQIQQQSTGFSYIATTSNHSNTTVNHHCNTSNNLAYVNNCHNHQQAFATTMDSSMIN